MGIWKAVNDFLSRRYFPSVLNIDLGDNVTLTFKKVDEVVDSLNDYQREIKRLPRSFAELVRVSNNFCNHVIKALKKYQKTMVSDYDSISINNYKASLIKDLDAIISECNNSKVQQLKWETYKDIVQLQNIQTGDKSGFIGNFASKLRDAAQETINQIERCPGPETLSKVLELDQVNNSKVKKLLAKLSVNISNPLTGKAYRAIGGASEVVRKFVAELFTEHTVEPIEYYQFGDKQYVGRSTVHAILNIFQSYKKDLKDYPKEIHVYVDACIDVIDKIVGMLKSYLSSLEVFTKPRSTWQDKIKARQNMKNILEKLEDYLKNNKNGGKQITIFCYINSKEYTKNKSDENKKLNVHYNQGRKVWPYASKDGAIQFGEFKNIDEQEIVMNGWSLGHFLMAMEPVVARTLSNLLTLINLENNTIDYEKLEIKAPSSIKNPSSEQVVRKDILKKADSLKEHVKELYSKVVELKNGEHFMKDYNEDREGVKTKYNALFGKSGKYDEFMKAYGNLKKLDKEDEDGFVKLLETQLDRPLQFYIQHFSEMNSCAEKIEETCSRWLKYYSRDAVEGKRKKDAAENLILQNIKLFKKRFSKQFGEANDIFKEAKKEFDGVMKLSGAGVDSDLFAAYKKVVSNEYAQLIEASDFSLLFRKRALSIFDSKGFKEDNLYNCVKYAPDFEAFVKGGKEPLDKWLSGLRTRAKELKNEYDRTMNLFSKRKNKTVLEDKSKRFDKLVANLKTAISNYKKASELYEKYEKYKNLSGDKKFGISLSENKNVLVFKNLWDGVNFYYNALGQQRLDVIRNDSIVFENARLLLDAQEECEKCENYCTGIVDALKRMDEYYKKIEDLVKELELIRKNGPGASKHLINIRETYNAAKKLCMAADALEGSRFGAAFNGKSDVKDFKNLWQDLDSEYKAFCNEFDMPLNGEISDDVAKRISVDDKKIATCQKELKYFSESLGWMRGYFEKIKKLVDKLKNNEKIVSEVAEKVIENYKSALQTHSQYGQLGEVTIDDVFKENNIVKQFEHHWEQIKEYYEKLQSDRFGIINGSTNKRDETKILVVSGDDAKVEKCQEISGSIRDSATSMRDLFERIKILTKVLSKQSENNELFSNLLEEYNEYQNTLAPLVKECKELAKEVGFGRPTQTDLEKYIKTDENNAWERKKEDYNKVLEEYTKSKKLLTNAYEKMSKQGSEKLELGKLEYTPSEVLRKEFESFKNWVEEKKLGREK